MGRGRVGYKSIIWIICFAGNGGGGNEGIPSDPLSSITISLSVFQGPWMVVKLPPTESIVSCTTDNSVVWRSCSSPDSNDNWLSCSTTMKDFGSRLSCTADKISSFLECDGCSLISLVCGITVLYVWKCDSCVVADEVKTESSSVDGSEKDSFSDTVAPEK